MLHVKLLRGPSTLYVNKHYIEVNYLDRGLGWPFPWFSLRLSIQINICSTNDEYYTSGSTGLGLFVVYFLCWLVSRESTLCWSNCSRAVTASSSSSCFWPINDEINVDYRKPLSGDRQRVYFWAINLEFGFQEVPLSCRVVSMRSSSNYNQIIFLLSTITFIDIEPSACKV